MQIIVTNYNPTWCTKFTREAEAIRLILDDSPHRLHHIGSTSVPGLPAKPIIDILLEVEDLKLLDMRSARFQGLGYEIMGEYGIPRRRYFRKGDANRTHHVHAFPMGDHHVTRHLAFRDYLRAHTDIARTYGLLKQELAAQPDIDAEKYCAAKDPFIKTHEVKALEWYSATNPR